MTAANPSRVSPWLRYHLVTFGIRTRIAALLGHCQSRLLSVGRSSSSQVPIPFMHGRTMQFMMVLQGQQYMPHTSYSAYKTLTGMLEVSLDSLGYPLLMKASR